MNQDINQQQETARLNLNYQNRDQCYRKGRSRNHDAKHMTPDTLGATSTDETKLRQMYDESKQSDHSTKMGKGELNDQQMILALNSQAQSVASRVSSCIQNQQQLQGHDSLYQSGGDRSRPSVNAMKDPWAAVPNTQTNASPGTANLTPAPFETMNTMKMGAGKNLSCTGRPEGDGISPPPAYLNIDKILASDKSPRPPGSNDFSSEVMNNTQSPASMHQTYHLPPAEVSFNRKTDHARCGPRAGSAQSGCSRKSVFTKNASQRGKVGPDIGGAGTPETHNQGFSPHGQESGPVSPLSQQSQSAEIPLKFNEPLAPIGVTATSPLQKYLGPQYEDYIATDSPSPSPLKPSRPPPQLKEGSKFQNPPRQGKPENNKNTTQEITLGPIQTQKPTRTQKGINDKRIPSEIYHLNKLHNFKYHIPQVVNLDFEKSADEVQGEGTTEESCDRPNRKSCADNNIQVMMLKQKVSFANNSSRGGQSKQASGFTKNQRIRKGVQAELSSYLQSRQYHQRLVDDSCMTFNNAQDFVPLQNSVRHSRRDISHLFSDPYSSSSHYIKQGPTQTANVVTNMVSRAILSRKSEKRNQRNIFSQETKHRRRDRINLYCDLRRNDKGVTSSHINDSSVQDDMGMIGAKYVDPKIQQLEKSHKLKNNQRQKLFSQGNQPDFPGIPLSPTVPQSPTQPLSVRQKQSIPLSGRQAYQEQFKQLFSPQGTSVLLHDKQTTFNDSINDTQQSVEQSIMHHQSIRPRKGNLFNYSVSTYREKRKMAFNANGQKNTKSKQDQARTFLDAMREKALQYKDQQTMRNHQLQQSYRCKQNQKNCNQGKMQKINQVEKILVKNMHVVDENSIGHSVHTSTAFQHYEGAGQQQEPKTTLPMDGNNDVQLPQNKPSQQKNKAYSRDASLAGLTPKKQSSKQLNVNTIEKIEDSIMEPSYNHSNYPNKQYPTQSNNHEVGSRETSVQNPSVGTGGSSFPQRENSKISHVSKSKSITRSGMKQATPQCIQLRDKQTYNKKNFMRYLKEKAADAKNSEIPPQLPVLEPLNLDLVKKSEESMGSGFKSATEQSEEASDVGRFGIGTMSPKMGVLIKGIKLEPIEVKTPDEQRGPPQVLQDPIDEPGRRSKVVQRSDTRSPFTNIQSQVFQQYENIKKLQQMQQELISIQLNKATERSEGCQRKKEVATGIDGMRENEESVLMKKIASQQEIIQDGLIKCQQQIQDRQEGLISGALSFKNGSPFQQQNLDTVIKIVSQHQDASNCQSPHFQRKQSNRESHTNDTLMLQYPPGGQVNGNGGSEVLEKIQTPQSSHGRNKNLSSLYDQSDFPNNPMKQARYNKLSIEGENIPTLTQVSFGAKAKDPFAQSYTKNSKASKDIQRPPNESTNNTPRPSLLYQLQHSNRNSREGSKNPSRCLEGPAMEVVGKKLERLSPSKNNSNKRSQGIQGDMGITERSAPTTDRQGNLDVKEVTRVQENPIDTLQEFIAAYCSEINDDDPENPLNAAFGAATGHNEAFHNQSTAMPIQEEDPGLIPEGFHPPENRKSSNSYVIQTENTSPSCRSPIRQTPQTQNNSGGKDQAKMIEIDDAPQTVEQEIVEQHEPSI